MKRFFHLSTSITFAFILTFGLANAQVLTFESESHDFGEIDEEGGDQSHTFSFTNTGTKPVSIKSVQPSCGCTTPSWSKEPVEPGQQGFIVAKYDPKNRPGAFNKSLAVSTEGGEEKTYQLYIKGIVKKEVPSIAEKFPKDFDGIRLQSEYLSLGYRYINEDQEPKSFEIYNSTGGPLTFLPIENLPDHMQVTVVPTSLNPKETGKIMVDYDAIRKGDFGSQFDRFTLNTSTGKSIPLSVSAILELNPENLSPEEYAKKPQLSLEKESHNFGTISEGEQVKMNFSFTNKGGETLKLFKTKATCGCTAGQPDKMELAPGETSNITVSFNSRGKHPGRQTQSVTIYSNDPMNPTQRIMISGEVEKKEE